MNDFAWLSAIFAECQQLYDANAGQGSVNVYALVNASQTGSASVSGFSTASNLIYKPAFTREIDTLPGRPAFLQNFPPSLSGNSGVLGFSGTDPFPQGTFFNMFIHITLPTPLHPALQGQLSPPVAVGIIFDANNAVVGQSSFSADSQAGVLFGVGNPIGNGAANALYVISLANPTYSP